MVRKKSKKKKNFVKQKCEKNPEETDSVDK